MPFENTHSTHILLISSVPGQVFSFSQLLRHEKYILSWLCPHSTEKSLDQAAVCEKVIKMSASIPRQMQALIKKTESPSYQLEMIDTPVPRGDEVLIKVEAVSICGSDINLYQWNDTAKVIASVPFIPGHEATGTIVKCGPEVTNVKVGDRVAVENHFYCGECYQCRHDRRETCINMGQYGHGRGTMHGGCCQYSVVSEKYCYVLKTEMDPEVAALLEPLGVSHHAVEKLEVSGETVLIIGCGPVGLLAIPCAKVMGAVKVIAADIDENRLALARDLGADVTINTLSQNLGEEIFALTNNDGIGRIAEMSGASVMVNTMFSFLRKGGHVVMVGLPKQPLHVENVLTDIVFKSLTLKSIHGRRVYHTWQKIEEMVAKQQVDVTKVISHRFAMGDFEEAFSALFSGKACKIVLFP